MSVVISQDNKSWGTCCRSDISHVESVNELADHDFPVGNGQKLIPSVYLIIKPNESNDEL